MKQALILHAWYNQPTSQWYPWLKKELEKRSYVVAVPELPSMNTKTPNMKLQLKAVEKYNDVDLVVGHSLGAVLGLRLAERKRLEKLFLVVGWDFDDLYKEHKKFWPNKINHTLIKRNVKEIYCLFSDNDPYITAFQAEEMSKRLGGKFILVKGAGHFTEKFGITKIPEILEFL